MSETPTFERRRELITGPAEEPVTLAQVKTHARVLTDDDDDYIDDDVIPGVRAAFEREAGIAIINQTWRCWFDRPSLRDPLGWWDGVREGSITERASDHLKLLPWPLSSIDGVTYYLTDNSSGTYAASNYFLDGVSRPARLVLNLGAVWPAGLRERNALSVDVIAGYGADGDAVPADIKHALKTACAHAYEHRGDLLSPNGSAVIDRMLRPTVERYSLKSL